MVDYGRAVDIACVVARLKAAVIFPEGFSSSSTDTDFWVVLTVNGSVINKMIN